MSVLFEQWSQPQRELFLQFEGDKNSLVHRNVHLVLSVHNGSAFLLAGFLGGRFSGFRWPVEFKNVFLIQGFALQGHDGFMRAHAMLADDQCSSV